MDVMQLRRNLLMQQNQISCPYIRNGLVLWLDGINKGGETGKWIDLIGGKEFVQTSYGKIVSGDNYYQFTSETLNGSNYGGFYRNATDISSNYKTDTIEIAFKRNSQGSICSMFYGGDGISFIIASSNTLSYNSNADRNKRYTLGLEYQIPLIVSINNDRAVRNGTSLTTTSNDYWSLQSDMTTIGFREVSTNHRPYYGKIYSIRIYNRLLTEAEMLQNQRADNARFNFGLTI